MKFKLYYLSILIFASCNYTWSPPNSSNNQTPVDTIHKNLYKRYDTICIVLDIKNGFRNYKLGTSKSDYPYLLRDRTTNDYYNPKENLRLGDFKMDSVFLSFYNNQLCNIAIIIRGSENCYGILDIFKDAYGSYHNTNTNTYEWEGIDDKITYNLYTEAHRVYNEDKTYATVWIFNKELVSKRDNEIFKRFKESNQKAAKDL